MCCVCSLKKDINTSEYNRKIRLGSPFYCSNKCAISRNQNVREAALRYSKSAECAQHLKQLRDDRPADPFAYFLHVAKQRKRHDFDLTAKYLSSVFEQQKGLCALTYLPLVLPVGTRGFVDKGQFNAASLDRIDSSKGYVVGNVQFLCVGVNYMKNNWTDEYLRDWLKQISRSILSSEVSS